MSGHYGGNPFKWDLQAGPNNPHIMRYFMAKGFVMPWETVLDAACCTGYGSKLLSLQAKKVIGYEVDPGCIDSCNQEKPDNCEFFLKDLNTCELPDADVLVSLETIEHLTPEGLQHFFVEVNKHIKRCVIISTPIGGTSWSYKDEVPSPATEKNDFPADGDVEKLLVHEGSDWSLLSHFRYGYSHYGVYFHDQIHVPIDWVDRQKVERKNFEKI